MCLSHYYQVKTSSNHSLLWERREVVGKKERSHCFRFISAAGERPLPGYQKGSVSCGWDTDPPSLRVIVFPPCWVNPTWPNPSAGGAHVHAAPLRPICHLPSWFCRPRGFRRHRGVFVDGQTETYAPSPERVVAGSLGTKACSRIPTKR